MGCILFLIIFLVLGGIGAAWSEMSHTKWLMIFPIVLVIMIIVFLVLFFKKDSKRIITNQKIGTIKKVLFGAIVAVSLLSIICSFGSQRAEEQAFRNELKNKANQYSINHSPEKLKADGWIRGASSSTKCPKCGRLMSGHWFEGEIWAKCFWCDDD